MRNQSHFGPNGIIKCNNCKRSTREIGDAGNVGCCFECYEAAGLENMVQDGSYPEGVTREEALDMIEALYQKAVNLGGLIEGFTKEVVKEKSVSEFIGKRVAYRQTDEGPFDRIGIFEKFGRKYHQLKNSETGKTEYCFLDSFQVLEQPEVVVEEAPAQSSQEVIKQIEVPQGEEMEKILGTNKHNAAVAEETAKRLKKNEQARARRAAKKGVAAGVKAGSDSSNDMQ